MAQTIHTGQAPELLSAVLQAGLVPNLLGSPGIGKSDIIRELAKEFKLKVIDFRLAQSDPTDLNGFPVMNENKTRSHYAPPVTLPLEGDALPDGYDGWLLFFDEMNSAPKSVQAASYKVILDRLVGNTPIHENVAMVCAGNLETDRAITTSLSTAMQSRLVHFELDIHAPSWMTWAFNNGIDHRVTSFIDFRPQLLHAFKPDHADHTFPCPRTWEFMSKLIAPIKTMTADKLPLMAGTIGEGAALEFLGFTQIFEDLPNVKQIISDPEGVYFKPEPTIHYALTGLIGSITDATNIDKIILLINRLPLEFQVITMQNLMRINNSLIKTKELQDWLTKNATELV